MKNKFKIAIGIVILLFISVILVSCGNAETISAGEVDTYNFIDLGEAYYLNGHFSDSTSGGIRMFQIKAEVVDLDGNWIKIRNIENESGEIRSLQESREDLDSIWINLDHVMGITR